eukprot:TRINITY_DN2414_c0_g3_i1.p1 TRINITY_DN2414_c0_g3~~TRINITY_DN2414_c0_g3_i1.p1  ORF type:complete len:557 (+),score=201.65 TRINITY_DN2414_c0_g3_i1:46-1671(+)
MSQTERGGVALGRPLKKRPLMDAPAAPAESEAPSSAASATNTDTSTAGSSCASTSGDTSLTGSGDEASDSDDQHQHQRRQQQHRQHGLARYHQKPGGCCGAAPEDDKLAANRERNRVHAQKTRQRKKARLLDLQRKVAELREERGALQQAIDERATASLLLRLGNEVPSSEEHEAAEGNHEAVFDADAFTDEEGEEDDEADAGGLLDQIPAHLSCDLSSLSPTERERIRRERNRLHAKRTRTRKKLIFMDLEKQIRVLQKQVQRFRDVLQQAAGPAAEATPEACSGSTSGSTKSAAAAPASSQTATAGTVARRSTPTPTATAGTQGRKAKRPRSPSCAPTPPPAKRALSAGPAASAAVAVLRASPHMLVQHPQPLLQAGHQQMCMEHPFTMPVAVAATPQLPPPQQQQHRMVSPMVLAAPDAHMLAAAAAPPDCLAQAPPPIYHPHFSLYQPAPHHQPLALPFLPRAAAPFAPQGLYAGAAPLPPHALPVLPKHLHALYDARVQAHFAALQQQQMAAAPYMPGADAYAAAAYHQFHGGATR